MKWKLIIYLSIFFYMIISPNASNAHSPPDPLEGLLENKIFKEKSIIGPFEEEAAVTKFASIPAKCGVIIGGIPGWIFGGAIGGTIGLISAPFFAASERDHKMMAFIMWPVIFGAFGVGFFGHTTSFLGEAIIGTPFYLTQLVFYDLPKVVFHKDDKK